MTLQDSVQVFQHAALRRRVAMRYAAELAIDLDLAETFAKQAAKRYEGNKRIFQAMKKMRGQQEKYGQSFEKLLKNGNTASVSAQALIHKYSGQSGLFKGKSKKIFESGLEWLGSCVRFWGRYSNDYGAGSAEERLANSYAAAQQLESAIRGIPAALQGKEEPLDDSWREH
jgi:hypothetical protein